MLVAVTDEAAAETPLFGKKNPFKRKRETTTETRQEPAQVHTKPVIEVNAEPTPEPAEEPKHDPTLLNTELTPEQIDSLVAVWNSELNERAFDDFYKTFISLDNGDIDHDSKAAAIPDSIYISRLQALASPVQLPYNPVVKTAISRYIDNRREVLSRILALSKYYFPFIEDELMRQELPVELKMMPIIESALTPKAISRAGAGGLWQFIPSTGKSLGLEINSLVDERFDPVASTRAACKYLRDLYNIYKDWTLVIAAYNCGPGNVNKALARAGNNSKTFWDIYNYLPSETRSYVPIFIAASYACAYHKLHGIEVEASPLPLATDTVTVNRIMHFEQVASTIDIPIEMLRELNPQYKLDIIPATNRNYSLVLPLQFVSKYVENEQEIFGKDSTYLKDYINPANIDKKRLESQGSVYTVKKGDTLGAIARRYRVTVKDLMRWNGLKSDKLRIGQKLRIERR